MTEALLFHPLANLFPLIEGEAFERLVSDLTENGLREKIVLHPDGTILDGRNRYRACIRAGIDAHFEIFTGNDPVAFVISKNLTRRHLNDDQRRMVAAKLASMGRGRPAWFSSPRGYRRGLNC